MSRTQRMGIHVTHMLSYSTLAIRQVGPRKADEYSSTVAHFVAHRSRTNNNDQQRSFNGCIAFNSNHLEATRFRKFLHEPKSALQISRVNHISAASGVAYAEPHGATTLPNWTDDGPKIVLRSFQDDAVVCCAMRLLIVPSLG